MRSELKAFDTRDSFVIRNNLSTSRRMSNGGVSMELSLHDLSHSMSTSFRHQKTDNTFCTTTNHTLDPKIIRDLFLQPRSQVKRFKEEVTLAGKAVGRVKGTFKITNIPRL